MKTHRNDAVRGPTHNHGRTTQDVHHENARREVASRPCRAHPPRAASGRLERAVFSRRAWR